MKLAGPALALFFVSFFITSFTLANISGNGDISEHTFAVSCEGFTAGEQVDIPAGGYALISTTTPDIPCVYKLPASTQFFRFVALYKGTVGSSTPISGDLNFSSGDLFYDYGGTVLTTTPNSFVDAQSGDDYFAVAFDTDEPQTITDIKSYLRDSASGVSPIGNAGISNYNVLTFKWGAGPADNTPPVITIDPATQTLEATSSVGVVVDFTVSATDETSGDRPVACDKATGTTFSLGTTTITCTASDIAGNTATSTSEVVVQDTTAPTLTLMGSSTVELTVGDTFVDEGATTSDAVDTAVAVVVAGDTVDMATAGTYTITYNATDASGNKATEVTRTVVVSAPVVVPTPTPDPTPAPVQSSGGGGGGGGGGIVSGPLSIGYQIPDPVIPTPVVVAVTNFVAPTAETVAVTTQVTPAPVVAGVQTKKTETPVAEAPALEATPTPEPAVTPPTVAQTQPAAVATVQSDFVLPLWFWILLPILAAFGALLFVVSRPTNN